MPALDAAEKELREKLAGIAGALIERKRFSIAAHYRKVNENDFPKLERAVSEVVAQHRELRRMEGKKVYELLPCVDWDKGKAVLWLLENLGLEHGKVRPIYIGDDRTDEDAFRALEQRGVGILVSEEPTGHCGELFAQGSDRSGALPARTGRCCCSRWSVTPACLQRR